MWAAIWVSIGWFLGLLTTLTFVRRQVETQMDEALRLYRRAARTPHDHLWDEDGFCIYCAAQRAQVEAG